MSILKKTVGILGSVLLFVYMIAAITTYALAEFTEYETIKPVFTEVLVGQLKSMLTGAETSGTFGLPSGNEDMLRIYLDTECAGKGTAKIVLGAGSELGIDSLTVDCTEYGNLGEGESVIEYLSEIAAGGIFDSMYFKSYDCDFMDCIQSGDVGIVISSKGNEFARKSILMMVGGAVLGAILILISKDSTISRMRGIGWPLTFTGISYFFADLTKNLTIEFVSSATSQDVSAEVIPIVDAFMKPLTDSLLLTMTIGLILVLSSYGYQYYMKKKYGFPIS